MPYKDGRNSYQRVKDERAKLRQDIFKILDGDQTTIMEYKMMLAVEKAIWTGSVSDKKKGRGKAKGLFWQLEEAF